MLKIDMRRRLLLFAVVFISFVIISAEINQVKAQCTDSDGGVNVGVKGTCNDGIQNVDDYCQATQLHRAVSYQVSEYSCNAFDTCVSGWEWCPLGEACVDGRCVAMSSSVDTDDTWNSPDKGMGEYGTSCTMYYDGGTQYPNVMWDYCINSDAPGNGV